MRKAMPSVENDQQQKEGFSIVGKPSGRSSGYYNVSVECEPAYM
jgi:hypothetical protein